MLLATVAVLAALLAACSGGSSRAIGRQGLAGPRYTLRTLASAELTGMRPILDAAARATGVTVKMTPMTTLAGSRAVASGKASGRYDATWFATDRYLAMSPGGLSQLAGSAETMSSPVVIGVTAAAARRLGWDNKAVSWEDVAAAVAAHRLTFGLADPASSDSGLSALVSVAPAVPGDGAALQPSGVTQAVTRLREFSGGQLLSAPSSSALTDAYAHAPDSGAGPVDGLIDYESDLLALNASGLLREPLKLIYPADGTVTSAYTLSLLASAPPAAQDAYDRLTSYLLTPRVQRQIMHLAWYRPAIPGIRLGRRFGPRQLFQLPFPGSRAVLADLTSAYAGTLPRPVRTVYVMDVSGSMRGSRLALLKALVGRLADAGGAFGHTGRPLPASEEVTLAPFASSPYPPETFQVAAGNPQPAQSLIRAVTASQSAGGHDAIYDALDAAYQAVLQQAATGPVSITTIVLLTDGDQDAGPGLTSFASRYRSLPPAAASVPVLPILIGPGSTAQMQQLAALTGGQVFDGNHLTLAAARLLLSLIRGIS